MEDFRNYLKNNIVLLDGAMGTMLLDSGADLGVCPEILNITNPELIQNIHKKYIKSGAKVVYANTFGANSKKIPNGYNIEDIIKAAIFNAKSATNGNAYIAYDMGPTGQLLEPAGNFTFDNAYELFKEQVLYAKKYGADLIICETITDLYEMKAALLAVKENCDLPVICTMSFDENMRTFQGTSISCMALTLEGLDADCIGINCSLGPKQILPIAKELVKWTNLPIAIKANAGIPLPGGNTYSVNADEFRDVYKEFLSVGVTVIGGCCGTTPEYIAKLKDISENFKHIKREYVNITACCSAVKTVNIDGIKVIGERLNPTGKKVYRQALINNDFNYIISQGVAQVEAGADILDVNTGLPEIDEVKVMTTAVKTLQSVLDVPLQIDSSNTDAIENALRYYNGKAIVNSVNGDNETLNKILPIVKKYGALVIGLTLDKNGLPNTTEKRLEIAEKIIACAKKHGISQNNVIIDPLALTVSTEQEQVEKTLQALKIFKSKGIKTLLGVSNISFGLPQRDNINVAFLISALNSGLNLPIINPNSPIMMNAVNSFRVLSGQDKGADNYINLYKNNQNNLKDNIENKEKQKDIDIYYCILKGLKEECNTACKKLLENNKPMDIVNNYIIPSLDKVGDLFDKGTIFLPQLIRSADTVKSAFDVIKKSMPKGFIQNDKTIIMATVKGDIHDIGKNIVKTVLENYGYNIIDIGKNAVPQAIIDAAKKHNSKLIGLSALMTTTVSNMEMTIKLIRKSGHKCKIMVGGAVLTEDYALKIGADFYAKDANASAKIAKKVFAE